MPVKLVVGLGNPGRKYVGTRHNVGFYVLAELARRYGTSRPKARFGGEVVEAQLEEAAALLLCPHTYMNNSGKSVIEAQRFFKLENAEILVVCDDFHLPLAKLRIRAAGSAGGQNGLADIIRRLGTEEVPRLRVGVGTPPAGYDAADYVLGKFDKDERPVIDDAIVRAADAVVLWANGGVEVCMNQIN